MTRQDEHINMREIPAVLVIPIDDASIEEGKRLASIYCASCHGEDQKGTEYFHDPALAIVDAPNLSSGRGGVGSYYSEVDMKRTVSQPPYWGGSCWQWEHLEICSTPNPSITTIWLRLPRFRQHQPNMGITWSRPSVAAPAMARNWLVVKIRTQTRRLVPT
jgi:hypothetical protein